MQPYRPPSRDYSRHIVDNLTKGSGLCPLGSAAMGDSALLKDLGIEKRDEDAIKEKMEKEKSEF